jgi:diguanylate cyclase (GGDEF)-like protein
MAMISLKYHLERDREEAIASAFEYYQNLVAVVAESGTRACPSIGNEFHGALTILAAKFSGAGEKDGAATAARQVEREVDDWGNRASDYYARKTAEVREIMLAMTEAAQAASRRDEQYGAQFAEVSAKLQQIGTLEDLSEVRRLVNKTAADVRQYAERMVEEGAQSIAGLRAQLNAYEERLQESERKSETDLLTGLANRAGIERAMTARAEASRPFSVLVADLNGFKQINDDYGPLAGDEALKQFSVEFRAQFRALDVVGRWGGDEFVAVIDGAGPREIEELIERIRNWACGKYSLPGVAGKVQLNASVGAATWRTGMSPEQVFAEADRAMYADKQAST